MKRCVGCGSQSVRRSRRDHADFRRRPFQSPYRCNACGTRFWTISHATRVSVGVIGAAALVVIVVPMLVRHMLPAPPRQADTSIGPDAIGLVPSGTAARTLSLRASTLEAIARENAIPTPTRPAEYEPIK